MILISAPGIENIILRMCALKPIKEIPNCLFLTLILCLITGTGTLLSYFSLSFWLGKENKKDAIANFPKNNS